MPGENEIIRKIRKGDIREFESLFRSSYSSLVRYARNLVKNHDVAEEIVQDLFFRLWQDREKLIIKSSLSGYLFKSVHNRCLHHIEHQKVVRRHEREKMFVSSENDRNPSDELQYEELRAKVATILERLPERCSTIFYMSRFEGLKYVEIADKLSISVKTVEANMGKALREFRKVLEE